MATEGSNPDDLVCVAGSHVTSAKLLAYAAKLQRELDAANASNASLSQHNEELREDVQRLTTEGKELAQRLVDQMSARPPPAPRGSSRNRSPSAPHQDRNRSFVSDESDSTSSAARQSYGWSARVDSNDRWEYSQDAGAFPIDADYLVRDEETRSVLDRAMRHSPACAALCRRLVTNVAAAERQRNADLEARKDQLQAALAEAAASRCLHDCAARLCSFEKIRTGLQKQHAGKIGALIADSVKAVRDEAVAAQRARAEAAEAEEETRRRTAANMTRAHSQKQAAQRRRDDVSTLPDPSDRNASYESTLPDPSCAAASNAAGSQFADVEAVDRTTAAENVREGQHQARPHASTQLSGNQTVAAPAGSSREPAGAERGAFSTSENASVTVTRVHQQQPQQQPTASARAYSRQLQQPPRNEATAPRTSSPDQLAADLYRDLEMTRLATSAPKLDLQARLLEYQLSQVARANQSTTSQHTVITANRRPRSSLSQGSRR